MILTIVGCLLTLRGVLCFFFPGLVKTMIEKMRPRLNTLMRIGGGASILIALAVLYPVL